MLHVRRNNALLILRFISKLSVSLNSRMFSTKCEVINFSCHSIAVTHDINI